jgi:hypothetical protein
MLKESFYLVQDKLMTGLETMVSFKSSLAQKNLFLSRKILIKRDYTKKIYDWWPAFCGTSSWCIGVWDRNFKDNMTLAGDILAELQFQRQERMQIVVKSLMFFLMMNRKLLK